MACSCSSVLGHGGIRAAIRVQHRYHQQQHSQQHRLISSRPGPGIRIHQVRAAAAGSSSAERLQSLSGVVTDANVPEGHSGLHGFLYGDGGAEVHDGGAATASKQFQGRQAEDDGSSILEMDGYVAARETIKFPGVYAVYDENKVAQYVGFSRNVILSLKAHRTRAGESRCAFVRVKLFADPSLVSKSKLEEEQQRWIQELEAAPPGNSPEEIGLWENSSSTKVVETSNAKAKSMSETERREYEEKKLKLRKAMGENLHDDVDGEDEDAKLRRLKILQAVEGDNWSSVIDGQTMETVDPGQSPSSKVVVSPFESKNTNSSGGGGGGLYSAETYEFTTENVDKVLDEVRPYLVADGGNVAVVSITDGTVSLELQGACGSCPSSTSTMKMGIERVLREKFGDSVKEVVDINKPSLALTFETLNQQIDILRGAIEGYGGTVQLSAVDPMKGQCEIKYKGPVPLGLGIKAAIRDKFPHLNVVLIDPLVMDAVWRSNPPRPSPSSSGLGCSSDTVKCYAEALRRSGSSHNLWEGKRLHFVLKSRGYDGDTFLGNLLVQMYGKCGDLDQARSCFDRIVARNVFSWTILILAYFQNGRFRKALDAYQEMRKDGRVEPDYFIFSVALNACGALGIDAIDEGRGIHSHLIAVSSPKSPSFGKSSIVTTGLLDMYAKCGSVEDARQAFDAMQRKDIVAWGAIITAYSEHGDGKTTLEMFRKMEQAGTKPNMYAYSGVLDACSRLGALSEGMAFHNRIVDVGLENHLVVATAIVTMYSRCGRMQEARSAFDNVKNKDLVCWNTLLAGFAQHGHCDETLELFQEMVMESIELNYVTFNSILHACSHTGLVELARSYFVSMSMDHGMSHEIDHYVRLIDVLGRAGWINQAEQVVDEMPFQPTSVIWVTLLGSYKMHGRIEKAEFAADRVLELDPENTAAFVLLSNIYGRLGRWDDVRRIRRAMQGRSRKKLPAVSYIEIKNRLHEFGAAGKPKRTRC